MLSRLILAAIAVSGTLPDVAPNPVPRAGETLAPRKTTAVEMSAETVHITLLEDTARIEASFTLLNTFSEKEELEVGFPTAVQPENYSFRPGEGMNVTKWGPASLREFTAKVDGSQVKATPKAGVGPSAYRGWLCWPMSFEPHQKRSVEVRYLADTRDDNYSEPSPLQNRQVTYILKTGAGWKGNIGEAVIILNLEGKTSDNIIRVAPEATEKGTKSWTWKMKDFEPTADILIQYRVYSGAKEAVEKLSAKLKANGSDIETLLDYADNLVATEQPLQAAEAFVRLHELEAQTGHAVYRPRTPYEPPAYRAAKCFHEAGKADAAQDWAKKGKARIEEVIAKQNEFFLRKVLRTSKEALAKRLEDCRTWAGE
jgi:hypothetical protein